MCITRSGKVLESVNSVQAQSSKPQNKITTTAGKVFSRVEVFAPQEMSWHTRRHQNQLNQVLTLNYTTIMHN